MSEYVIQIRANALTGEEPPTPIFVEIYDPSSPDGRGDLLVTPDIANAKVFASVTDAIALYRAQSETVPLRPDGKPNRPLTAFTVEIKPK